MPLIKKLQSYSDPEQDQKRRQMAPGAGAPGIGAAPATSAPQQAQAGQTSVAGSQHVNLVDYLKANEGQGKQMADKVAGGIEQGASKIAGAQPVKMNSALKLEGLGAPPKQSHSTFKYGDPGYLTGQAEQDAANKVSEQANLAATGGGQQQLLDKAYGSGRSQGEADFDNALMGAGGGGRLQELTRKYGGLADWVREDQAGKAYRKSQMEMDAEDARRKAAALKGPGPNRTLGYGPNGESEGGDPNNVGVNPNKNREASGGYESFANGTNNGVNSGADWFRRNVPEALWNKLSDSELGELMDAIAELGGERTSMNYHQKSSPVDDIIAKLKSKYGS